MLSLIASDFSRNPRPILLLRKNAQYQPSRGPSESEATNPADVGIQAIRQRGNYDFRNRARREDQEGAVQNGQTRWVQCNDVGVMERRTGSLSPIRKHLQGGA